MQGLEAHPRRLGKTPPSAGNLRLVDRQTVWLGMARVGCGIFVELMDAAS